MVRSSALLSLHKWRAKYISNKNFTLIISVVVGAAAGLAAALLKNTVFYIQDLLFSLCQVIEIEYLYLIFSLTGLLLTIGFVITFNRNIFPVVDEAKKLQGIILLDDIREVMFKPKLYDTLKTRELMHPPPAYVYLDESMAKVMEKFEDSGAWNLPVLEDEKYIGFLSKSKIFSVYRTMLKRQTKEE